MEKIMCRWPDLTASPLGPTFHNQSQSKTVPEGCVQHLVARYQGHHEFTHSLSSAQESWELTAIVATPVRGRLASECRGCQRTDHLFHADAAVP